MSADLMLRLIIEKLQHAANARLERAAALESNGYVSAESLHLRRIAVELNTLAADFDQARTST